jgi:stage V sporulation protein AA
MPKVFENYYKIFYGRANNNPLIIDIPYSIGLAVGIIVFFNHFMGKKITDDPTPIEVEMALYETEVNETVLDVLNTQRMDDRHGNS